MSAQPDTRLQAGGALRAPDLASLPRERLERMRAAGREIVECRRVLAKAGLNVVGEVLRGQGTFYENEHYPADDVIDAETGSQYYYHAHRGLEGEHGHFHTFLRASAMPAGMKALDVPHEEPWPEGDDAHAHLIAISMDAGGEAMGLFAVNRWVTGDTWYAGRDLATVIERFRIDHAYPSWPVNRWMSAMFVLFGPHIEALLAERDRVIAAHRAAAAPGEEDVFERRELEVLAGLPISVDAAMAEVEAALR